MSFDFLNYLNCIIEAFSMLLMWKLTDSQPFKIIKYFLAFVLLCASAIPVTLIDSVLFSLLPVNFLMIFLCMWIGFCQPFKDTLLRSLFLYLLLLYLQSIAVCLLPQNLMGTNTGNLLVNTFVFVVLSILVVLGHKYHFAEIYQTNLRTVWIFLLALCLPEIVLAQVFVALLGAASSPVMIILLLLQMLYMALVILLFFILKRKSENRQFADTQKYIREMNEHLEESRRSMHDFNKHIRYLRNAIMVGSENQELIHNVNTYCEELLDIYEKEEILLQLDDPVLRAILYGRRAQASAGHIDFILNASPVLPVFPLKSYQIVEVFDNLINNAFECVAELPEDRRWIRITLSSALQENGRTQHMLCIENPCPPLDLSLIASDKKYTSKGGTHQGVGLKHVAHVVSGSGGKLILNNRNNIFIVKILYEA